jgi:hypothetical protein
MKYPIRDIFIKYYSLFLKSYRENYYHSKVINAIIKCKTKALGGHSTVCFDCGNVTNHYNSCGNRHCPNCQSLVQAKWVDKRKADVLNASYFHTVFTIPNELNSLFICNQQKLYSLLFKASATTLKLLAKDKKHLNAEIGFISVLHTFGSNLSYHPHIHVIILGGGLTKDLKFKHSKSKSYLFPARVIANLFRKTFLEMLSDLYYKKELIFSNKVNYLENEVSFEKFKIFLKNKKWNIKIKETLNGAKNAIEYLGNYTHRIAISNSRIVSVTDEAVTFKYKDYKNNGEIKLMKLHPVEFIRRFTMHILPKGFIKMRHYGILGNRNKKNKLAICRNILKGIYPKSELDGLNTAETLYKLFKIDILRCKECGSTSLIKMPLIIQRE